MSVRKQFERGVESAIFGLRWIMAPVYLALMAVLALLARTGRATSSAPIAPWSGSARSSRGRVTRSNDSSRAMTRLGTAPLRARWPWSPPPSRRTSRAVRATSTIHAWSARAGLVRVRSSRPAGSASTTTCGSAMTAGTSDPALGSIVRFRIAPLGRAPRVAVRRLRASAPPSWRGRRRPESGPAPPRAARPGAAQRGGAGGRISLRPPRPARAPRR
jgi:hypothetical protein